MVERPQIYIIQDDADIRQLLHWTFELDGRYEVADSAGTLPEALDMVAAIGNAVKVRKHRPVLVLDYDLGVQRDGADGERIAALARHTIDSVLIVDFSASSPTNERITRVDAYVPMPDYYILPEAVRTILELAEE